MTRIFATIFFGFVLMLGFASPVPAGTFEDAVAAYARQDYATALRLYRSLADQGQPDAMYNLALMYAQGQGIPQRNYAEAAKWFRLAASQGVADAQNDLSTLYRQGQGVPQNYAEAAKWAYLAASQGHPNAQSNLGAMYNGGIGVPQNYTEAAKWYRLAANQGTTAAQFNLALMYYNGLGVPQNYVLSYMWLSLSAAQGNQRAVENRDLIVQIMTPSQIAEAQKLAAEWRPERLADAARPAPPKKSAPETSSGTAFFVSNKGEALTNAHVVEGCQQIRVNGGRARLLARDVKNDLALLATDQHPAQWSNWSLSVRLGEDVIAFGFPLTGTLSSSGNVTTGIVTALACLGDDSRFLQISAPVQPGNSGGPLFDRYGNVVGVVVAKLNALKIASATGDIPQNVNFAIKASVAKAFLDAQRQPNPFDQFDVFPDAVQTPLDHPVAPMLSTPDIAARAQALAVQVVCIQ